MFLANCSDTFCSSISFSFSDYNSYRCSAAGKEYCLCARETGLPPPPPAKQADELEWSYSGTNVAYDFSSSASAFYKIAATDLAMPEDFRGYTKSYECPGEDDGAAVCARHCSDNLKDDLVAFSVSGKLAVSIGYVVSNAYPTFATRPFC